MKGILNKFVLMTVVLFISGCVAHTDISCINEKNSQKIFPTNKIFNYKIPLENKTNIKKPNTIVPVDTYPARNQMLYQNPDSGTNSTGPT